MQEYKIRKRKIVCFLDILLCLSFPHEIELPNNKSSGASGFWDKYQSIVR